MPHRWPPRARAAPAGRSGCIGTLKWGSIAAAVLLVLGVVGVVIAYNRTAIPQPNELANKQVSIVYYSDGKTELDRIAVQDGNRESVQAHARCPKFVQDAHIAAEDRTFYQNNGISVGGILRAVKTSVTGETQVGGSTITQQYVKNYFLTQDRTISRKAKEILIAVKIDGQLSKSEILEKYLNTIYYGRGAYGIQSAAKAYFGKDVSKLTVGEGAVLASVINAPVALRPRQRRDGRGPTSTKRYAYVLDGMVQEGWLSAADRAKYERSCRRSRPTRATSSRRAPTATSRPRSSASCSRPACPSRTSTTAACASSRRSTRRPRPPRSRRCRTTCRRRCRAASSRSGPATARSSRCTAAPTTRSTQFNTATQATMQGASNFKPFAVLAAVRDGVSTKTKFDGDQPAGDRRHEDHELRRPLLRHGRHAPDDRSLDQHGLRQPQQRDHAGADPPGGDRRRHPGEDRRASTTTLTNVLGTASPHVIDMASAYSTIASQGVRAKPYFVKKVTSTTSDFSYEAKPQTKRAFDKDVTADVTDAMTYTVKDGGTATKLQRLGPPGRRQDRHVLRGEVDLVLRLRPAARRVDRHVQARRERQPADPDELRGHQPHAVARSRPTSSTTS